MSDDEIIDLLAQPFEPFEVQFKPSVVQGNRALALAYIDARVVQDRLDKVLGVANWQDEYVTLPDGSVVCRLRLRLGGEWITKMDVGGESEQKDPGDRRKAAFSDALKRAAVKFGVGRYLYRLPSQWCDYDPKKRQFVRTPSLPGAAPKAAPASPLANVTDRPPADGAELERWLRKGEAIMVGLGWCSGGELLDHVQHHGRRRRYPAELFRWTGEQIAWAIEEAGRWKEARKADAEKVARQEAEAKGVL